MSTSAPAFRAIQLLERLEQIMEAEDGERWIPVIQATRGLGEEHAAAGDVVAALKAMSSSYRALHAGVENVGEFFVWRDSLEERQKANEELACVQDELWSLLGS